MPTEPASDAERATEIEARVRRYLPNLGSIPLSSYSEYNYEHFRDDLRALLSDRAAQARELEDRDRIIARHLRDVEILVQRVANRDARIEALTRESARFRNALAIIAGPRTDHRLTDYLRAHGNPPCTTLANQYEETARAALSAPAPPETPP